MSTSSKPASAKKQFTLKCPDCGAAIHISQAKIAKLMGAMAKGVRKKFSKAERARRAERMKEARKFLRPKGSKAKIQAASDKATK